MARLYVGDVSRIHEGVLKAVKTLEDDYWVLAEFSISRNIDWFIIGVQENAPATLIVLEVKTEACELRGGTNEPWSRRHSEDRWEPIVPSNKQDINYYWQVVNAANALQDWLRNNEPVFNEGERGTWAEAKVWPDLLLLSPPGIVHQLPRRPDSRYGAWYYDVASWVQHVRGWRPKTGPVLKHEHVERLVKYLGLTPIDSLNPELQIRDLQSEVLQALERRIQPVEERLGRIEATLQALVVTLHHALATSQGPLPVEHTNGDRPLTELEKLALIRAVMAVRQKRASRTPSSVLSVMGQILGYDLKKTGYNGFSSASAFLERAAKEGVIKFGPPSGPNPTIWLPEELA